MGAIAEWHVRCTDAVVEAVHLGREAKAGRATRLRDGRVGRGVAAIAYRAADGYRARRRSGRKEVVSCKLAVAQLAGMLAGDSGRWAGDRATRRRSGNNPSNGDG
ncbi:hypothetical protein NL676_028555 [Syzygium grande]|nr:hypothetical protein NL676_028555 [Syzygium grande]